MSIFNVQVIRRVTLFNEEKTESQVVDRVLASECSVVAIDSQGAAAVVGRKISASVTDEILSMSMVRVQKVSD